jgi:membrane-bound serine protease (ClpP class)
LARSEGCHPLWRAGVLLAFLMGLAGGSIVRGEPGGTPRVITLELFEAIQPVTAQYVKQTLQQADRANCALVILSLDTPGGLVLSTQEIVKAITGSKVPVVVFVSGSHAASAGFFITLAADVAVMAPGTRFGAAHPVGIFQAGEKRGEAAVLLQKAENDLAAWIRTLAQNRGRNVSLAEEAVRSSRAFTEQEALAGGLIDYILPSQSAILQQLDGKTIRRFTGEKVRLGLTAARVERIQMSARDRFLSWIADPEYVLFLLILGVLGLYAEFTHPGLIFPGVFGSLCLLCFAAAVQILPINYVGLLLVLLGVALFILELKVVSHGILTVGGIAALMLGALMLFRREEAQGLEVPLWSAAGLALSAALLMAFLTHRILWAHRQQVTTGLEGLVGTLGEALSDLNPTGRVFVHGESWSATSSSPVARGKQVKVTRVQGMMLEVEELRTPAEPLSRRMA